HRYDSASKSWKPYSAPPLDSGTPRQTTQSYLKSFALITWNVDFSRSYAKQRLITALNHLQSLVEELKNKSSLQTIILLQELHQDYYTTLLDHPFVQENYDVTDEVSDKWLTHYGLATLIPRSDEVRVRKVFSTPFEDSRMGREALFVDLEVAEEDPSAAPKIVRIANTHLESLDGFGNVARPKQLAAIARELSVPEVDIGIVGGDMNPIGPKDADIPASVNLLDAWEVYCGQPSGNLAGDPEEMQRREKDGHTWGYQPPSRYAPKRMDKVLFRGPLAIRQIERIGVGLKVAPERVEQKDIWASDHCGL
ncbi:hypothetical protein CPC08DRAFT_595015, partial [Agrocybe pediades]